MTVGTPDCRKARMLLWALVCVPFLVRDAVAGPETLDSGALPPSWQVRGADDADLTITNGCVSFFCGPEKPIRIDRALDADGTDEQPLRVSARIRVVPATPAAPAVTVCLTWADGATIAVGACTNAAGRVVPGIAWQAGDTVGSAGARFELSGWQFPNTFRFLVQTKTVDIAVSRDGLDYRHVGTVLRSRTPYASPPAALRIGHMAPPDAGSNRGAARVSIEHIAVDSGPIPLPALKNLGYARRGGWEASEATVGAGMRVGPLLLFEPRPVPRTAASVAQQFRPGPTLPTGKQVASIDPLRESNGTFAWRQELTSALPSKSRPRDYLVVTVTDLVVDGPATVEVRHDTHPHGQCFLDGRPMTPPRSTASGTLTEGRGRFTAPVRPGTNRLAVVVWNVHRERHRGHALSLRVRRHDPLSRVALLRQLSADFPGLDARVHASRQEEYRLLKSVGFLSEALGALPAVNSAARDGVAETATGLFLRALLLGRLGRFGEAAASLRGTPLPPPVRAAIARQVATWQSIASGVQDVVFVPSPADSESVAELEQVMHRAEELKQASDFAEAAMLYTALVQTPISPDLSLQSALSLVGLQDRFGFADHSRRTSRGVAGLLPDRPDLGEALLQALASRREPVILGFRPSVSSEARNLLETADRALQAKEWLQAVDLYHQAMSSHRGALIATGDGRTFGVDVHVRDRLMGLPAAGVEAYEERFGSMAAQRVRQAAGDGPAEWIAAARAFPGANVSAHALNSAATFYLDRGRPGAAAALLAALAVGGRSTPLTLAKWALAAEQAGLPAQAAQAYRMLDTRFGDRSLTVAGIAQPVRDYIAAQRKRPPLTGAAPSRQRAVQRAWRTPFPGTPADNATAFLGWPHPYSISPYLPVTADGAVVVQSTEDAFAFELADGSLRWRTARPLPHLAPDTGDHVAPALLRPTVHDDLVLVRVLSRGPANGRQRTVLEARRLADGRAVWATETNVQLSDVRFVSQPVAYADRVLALCLRHADKMQLQLLALDARDGHVLWRSTLTGDIADAFRGPYGQGRRAHVAYFTDQGDESRGREHLQDHCGPPVVADGMCYAATDVGLIAAVDVFDGAIRWLHAYPQAHYPSGSSHAAHVQSLRTPPELVVEAGRLIVAPRDTLSVVCLDRTDGRTIWSRDYTSIRRLSGLAGGSATQAVVVAEGTAVEGLAAESGQRLWQWRPDPEIQGRLRSTAVDGDRVLAVCSRGVGRLASGTGRLEEFIPWTDLGSTNGGPPNAVLSGDAVLGVGNEQLLCLVRHEGPRQAPASASPPGENQSAAAALYDTPQYPGCKHIGGGPTRIAASDSTHVLAWIGGRLALIDAAREALLWSVRLGRGTIHVRMMPDRVALVYPEQIILLDRRDGTALMRLPTPLAGEGGGRITAAAGQDYTLAVGGGAAVHVLDAERGTGLCTFELKYRVRRLAALTNAVLTLSQSTEHQGNWRADLHAVPSGKMLAGQDISCRSSWQTPPAVVANHRDGALTAFAEGNILHHRTDAGGPPLRVIQARLSHLLEAIRANGDKITMVHRTAEKGRGGLTETTVIDVSSGGTAFKQQGTWTIWPDLAVGSIHRTHVHKDRVGADHRAYRSVERSGRLICRGADGQAIWERGLPMGYETSHGRWRDGGALLELVSRDRWSHLYGNHTDTVWEDMFRRWPGGEPDRILPALDVRPNGMRDLVLRRIDLGTGAVRTLRTLPGAIVGAGGDRTARMCAGHLAYATDQGLFLVSQPTSTPRAEPDSRATAPGSGAAIPYAERTIRIDGLLDDWTGIPDAELAPARPPSDSPPEEAHPLPRVKLAWDDLRLCIAVAVDDMDRRPAAPGASLWDGDGVLIAIDPEADGAARFGRRRGREQDNDTLVYVGASPDGIRLIQFYGLKAADPRERVEDRAQAAETSDGQRTTYEIALPLDALLINGSRRLGEGSQVGVGLAVVSARDRVRIREFGGGIVAGLNPSRLVRCTLVSTSTEREHYTRLLARDLPDHPAAPRRPPEGDPVLAQYVYLDPLEPPEAIALICRTRSQGFQHGSYWADSPEACGGFIRAPFVYMGKLPSPGTWHELRASAWRMGLGHRDLINIGWGVKDGKAWWGRTTWTDTDGKGKRTRILVEKDPDGKPIFSGSGYGHWVDQAPGDRADVHAPNRDAGWCFYYAATTNALVLGRSDPSKNRTPEQWLDACTKLLGALKDNRMLTSFLRDSERLPLSTQQLAQLYRAAVRAHPDSSWTHRLLTRLLLAESEHAVVRRRYSLWLDRGVGKGTPPDWAHKPLSMKLTRIGRQWLPDVVSRAPTFNVSNHSGVIQDLSAPETAITIIMNIGYDPWVPGDKNAPFTLDLHVQDDGVVYGLFVRTFRGDTLTGAVSGRCVADYIVTEEDGASETALSALASVRSFARQAGVTSRQRSLFERQLARTAPSPAVPAH